MDFSLRRLLKKVLSESFPELSACQGQLNSVSEQLAQLKILAAQPIVHEVRRQTQAVPLTKMEFKVFSQFGDDGIIQYVTNRLNLTASEQRFVEFGVEDYRESNTRFLLLNDNWSGLIMDGSEDQVALIQRDPIYWRHDLTALARFVTRENINSLLCEGGFSGRIGILSIDVDGNDYWIWEAINVVDPALVIIEYNGIFGDREAVTIPYKADFVRQQAHYSYLYWGTSLPALCHLAVQKGYIWIGCNSAGNNAYFVRADHASQFYQPSLPIDFVPAKFREGRNRQGSLSYIGQRDGFELIKDLLVWDVSTNEMRAIASLVR